MLYFKFGTRRMGQFLATLVLLLLFHTEFVLTVCPENCLSCTDQTNCTKCKANKWRTGMSLCFADCSTECLNGECHDDTGYCFKCEDGKYGRWCQYNCSDCKNENCELYRCAEGCKSGYFEYQTTSYDYFCQSCPTNCKLCDDGNICRICNSGYYLNKFYYNDKTYVNCAKCLNGYECPNFCLILGCNHCKIINNRPVCAECPEGETFNGISCDLIAHNCSQKCSTNCDSNGICLGTCSDGWTGERCTGICNEKCLICSKDDRNMCIQCNGDFYSKDCSFNCNPSCKVSEGKNSCDLDNGYCLNGCLRDHWGETCNTSCPEECKDHECDRNNGMCTRGCKDGYTGDRCIIITTKDQQEPIVTITPAAKSTGTTTLVQNQASEVKIFIIGFFSGIGFSLVIVAIVILLYFMRRRYLGNKAAQNNNRNVEIPTYIETANNYETLSHNRAKDTVYSDLGTTA